MIDTRAGSVNLIRPLKKRKGSLVEPATLQYGDVAFLGNMPGRKVMVGIEYKTIGDLMQCLSTKRFVGHQLPGMLEEYGRSYLLIEGMYRAAPKSGALEVYERGRWQQYGHRRWQRPMMYGDLLGFLTSIEEAGVKVRRAATFDDTVETVVALYNWWSKKWEKHSSLKAIYDGDRIYERDTVLPVRRATFERTIAAQLPGIGWHKSARVVAALPTVLDMVTASRAEWEEIEGIGGTLSKRIHAALRGKSKGAVR